MNQTSTDDALQEIHGVNFLSRHVGELPVGELKALSAQLLETLGSGVVALTAIDSGQASLVVAVTSDFAGRIDAAPLAQAGVEALGGAFDGGARDCAQGGPHTQNAADALTAVGETLAAMLDATMRGEAEAIA